MNRENFIFHLVLVEGFQEIKFKKQKHKKGSSKLVTKRKWYAQRNPRMSSTFKKRAKGITLYGKEMNYMAKHMTTFFFWSHGMKIDGR